MISKGVITVNAGQRSSGTQITLTDQEGNMILSYAPELSFNVVILSCPDMISGENLFESSFDFLLVFKKSSFFWG